MTWIDYKKAYDVVLYSWIKEGEVDVKQGIFQDCLSPLVFVLALVPLSLILRIAKAVC